MAKFALAATQGACQINSDVPVLLIHVGRIAFHRSPMITAGQLRAARAMLGMDQRMLAEAAGLSVPTIQRMEASDGVIRGNVDSLMKLVGALDSAGLELINEGAVSTAGGRGLRFKAVTPPGQKGVPDSPGARSRESSPR